MLNACTEINLIQRIDTIENHHHIDLLNMYNDVFKGLGCITKCCLPYQSQYNIPTSCTPTQKNSSHSKAQNPTGTYLHEELDIIQKVDEPTDWVNSMMTIIKPNGKLRICISRSTWHDLNKAIKQEYYSMRKISEIITRMPNIKVALDASSGFQQIKLDPSSARLCTFNTSLGRYMLKCLPFGL